MITRRSCWGWSCIRSTPQSNMRCANGNRRSRSRRDDRPRVSLVTASIHIPAPREQVWNMVMDPRRLQEWVTIHRRLVRADDGAPRVGYRMDQILHLRGVNVEVHWELVECDPPQLAVWEGRARAHARAHTEYRLSAED